MSWDLATKRPGEASSTNSGRALTAREDGTQVANRELLRSTSPRHLAHVSAREGAL